MRGSITPFWARGASEVACVRTTMSSDTTVVHEAIGFALAFDVDEALPARADRREQRVVAEAGISMPIISAARITSVPLGTVIDCPSIVRVTRSVSTVVIAHPVGHRRGRIERAVPQARVRGIRRGTAPTTR